MTRINVVPPSELTREHLIAEYRELPRVFGLIRDAVSRGEAPDDLRNPRLYTLGKGHVRFFYDKLAFLWHRHTNLVIEMGKRGYSPMYKFVPGFVWDIPEDRWNNYEPTAEALAINRARIAERLSAKN